MAISMIQKICLVATPVREQPLSDAVNRAHFHEMPTNDGPTNTLKQRVFQEEHVPFCEWAGDQGTDGIANLLI